MLGFSHFQLELSYSTLISHRYQLIFRTLSLFSTKAIFMSKRKYSYVLRKAYAFACVLPKYLKKS